jgi:hypothetical protein
LILAWCMWNYPLGRDRLMNKPLSETASTD